MQKSGVTEHIKQEIIDIYDSGYVSTTYFWVCSEKLCKVQEIYKKLIEVQKL